MALLAIVLVAAGIALAVGLSGRGSSTSATKAKPPSPPASTQQQDAAAGQEEATKRQKAQQQALEKRADAAVARFVRLGLPVYCGGHRGRYVALTFDDGPGPETERVVLPLLRRMKARATFFVVGQNISAYPDTPRHEAALGAVGDHTWTHPLLTALSAGAVAGQLGDTQQAIERAAGRRPNLFRPPYGALNATVDAAARSLGLLEVLWSIDSYDSRRFPAGEVAHTVLKLVQPGAIILMHENLPATVKALPGILRVLEHRRFKLVTVSELLALDPPSLAQLKAGFQGCYEAPTSAQLGRD